MVDPIPCICRNQILYNNLLLTFTYIATSMVFVIFDVDIFPRLNEITVFLGSILEDILIFLSSII